MKKPLAMGWLACGLILGLLPLHAGELPQAIQVLAPASYMPGIPVLVRVEAQAADGSLARDLWDAQALLTADPPGTTLTPGAVTLRNGIGSALVQISAPQDADITLKASLSSPVSLESTRAIRSLRDTAPTPVSGTIPGPIAEWSGVLHITGPVTVPAGTTLRVLPGTLVLVNGVLTGEAEPGECESAAQTPTKCGTSITVRGALESMGTEAEPVTFTAFDPTRAWGEIRHETSGPSLYRHTIVSRAGNSPRVGHTNTGPAIRSTNSSLRFESCSLTNHAGKVMNASGSNLEFYDCLLIRSKMGPEIDGTALVFERSYAMEMHGPDDNDGIYLHSQKAGQTIRLTSSTIASGDDDAIDTLGSNITVEDCIVRDYRNPNEDAKGISVFSGRVDVKKCLLVNNKEGISAKGQTAGAEVHIDQCTLVDNGVGIHATDKFGVPTLHIKFFVNNTILVGPDAVITDYPQFPGDIQVSYTDLPQTWSGTGNIMSEPLFADAADHDYHLQVASPCVDAGDPAISDPDGTRADMGAFFLEQSSGEPRFVRGLVNGDASLDIADPVALLLHLFAGRSLSCEKAADANDDGNVNLTDALFLLDFLFRAGPSVAAPRGACGTDPTPDSLGCGLLTCP
jgi:hypothetical protein